MERFTDINVSNWSLVKQEEVKFRLYKEFGLSRLLNEKKHKETIEQAMQNGLDLLGDDKKSSVSDAEYEYFAGILKVREHFKVTLSHKEFILKSFSRFQNYFESKGITKEQAECHDDSKLTDFKEIVGYTHRWILNLKTIEWRDAWRSHYTNNPHHPEYNHVIHEDDAQQNIYGNMEYVYLVESVMDMIACRHERTLYGNDNVTNEDLLNIESCFLKRYTSSDRIKVLEIIDQLRKYE